jgi:hypothetical protein
MDTQKIMINTNRLTDIAAKNLVEYQSIRTKGYLIANSPEILRTIYNCSLKNRKIKPHAKIEEIQKCLQEVTDSIQQDTLSSHERKMRLAYVNEMADQNSIPYYKEHIRTHQKILKNMKITPETKPFDDLETSSSLASSTGDSSTSISVATSTSVVEEKKSSNTSGSQKKSQKKSKKKRNKKQSTVTSLNDEGEDMSEYRVAIDYNDINPNTMIIVDNLIETDKLFTLLNYSKELMATFVLYVKKSTEIPLGYGGYFELIDYIDAEFCNQMGNGNVREEPRSLTTISADEILDKLPTQ